MDIITNPYGDALLNCADDVERLENQLADTRALNNTLLTNAANFYTRRLKGVYFKHRYTKRVGQISHVFYKDGRFLAHLWVLEITAKSKVVRQYANVELFGNEMADLMQLNEDEYKQEFFDYVNERVRTVESED